VRVVRGKGQDKQQVGRKTWSRKMSNLSSSVYAVKALLFKWLGNPEILDFPGTDQELFQEFVYKAVNHEANRKVAEQFGVIVTQVKAFPTDSGWMILDKHTKRPLHKGVKNENEVMLLCQKHNYVR
jgi:hypothetical protein